MFTEKPYVLPQPPGEMVAQCLRVHLRVRVVECYLHQGVAGITLSLSREGHQAISAQTNAQGWVWFTFTGAQLTEQVSLKLIFVPPPDGQYASKPKVDFEPEEVSYALTLLPGGHKEITLTLAPDWVTPPADLAGKVNDLLRNSDVRLYVADGANLGNQAATIDFLQEMSLLVRRAAYADAERPMVRILSQAPELTDYPYKLVARVTDVLPANLKTFWQRYLSLAVPRDPEGPDLPPQRITYTLGPDGKSAQLTMLRTCHTTTLSDGSQEDETSPNHLLDVATLVQKEACAATLGLVDLQLKQESEFNQYAPSPAPRLTLNVTGTSPDEAPPRIDILITLRDGSLVTTDQLQALATALAKQLFPELEPVPQFEVSPDGVNATLAINRELAELDDCTEGSPKHVHNCLTAENNCAESIGMHNAILCYTSAGANYRLTTHPGIKSVVLDLKIRSFDTVSVRERLDVLASDIKAVYANASHVDSSEDFEAGKRANIIGILPAFDLGNPEMATTKHEVAGFKTALKSPEVLILQPYLWYPHRRYLFADDTFDDLCLPRQAAYVYGVPARLDDAGTIAQAPARLRPVFTRLLHELGAGSIRLQVGYGLHQAEKANAAGVIMAKALACMAAPKVVLLVPCKRPTFAEGFQSVGGVAVVNLEAADPVARLVEAIGSVETKAILLTTADSLPGPLFKQMVLRSQLPVLFEGANTAGLLLNAGLPHLSVKLKTTQYASKPDEEEHVNALRELTALLQKAAPEAADISRLANFFDKAKAGTSEVATYFTAISAHCGSAQLDQLSLALYRLHLKRNPTIVPAENIGVAVSGDALLA